MTVGELIKVLEKLDKDLPVYIRGYEAGIDDADSIEELMVERDVYTESYFGNHRPARSGGVPGVRIGSSRGNE